MRLAGVGDNSSILQHPLLGPGRITGARDLGPFPDSQVAQTIGVMRRRVLEDRANAGVQQHSQRVMDQPGGVDHVTRAWEQTRRAIAFVQDKELAGDLVADPADVVEVIIRPRDMARLVDEGRAHGDCDDFVMYCACLLECYGVPTSFVTVAADPEAPREFSHVYLRAYPYEGGREGLYVALDPSHGPYPGWECPNYFGKLQEWPVEDAWVWISAGVELFAASLFIGFLVWAVWR